MKFSYLYDLSFDLVDFSKEDEFKFKQSVRLDEGIFLDFDDEDNPVSLEMIGASKIFGVHKRQLENSRMELNIKIDMHRIKTEITVSFLTGQSERRVSVSYDVSNYASITSCEMLMTN